MDADKKNRKNVEKKLISLCKKILKIIKSQI